jgi:hypothetical protein
MMQKMLRFAFAFAAIGFLSGHARSQVITIGTGGGHVVIDGGAGVPAAATTTAPAPAAASAQAPAAAPSARQQKLKALEFDRRASAILAAWATPPKAPPPPQAATEETAGAGGDEAAAVAEADADAVVEAGDAAEAGEAAEGEVAPAEPAPPEAASAAEEAARKAAEAKALEEELALFQRRVTLGEWEAVGAYLDGLSEDEGKEAYARLLDSLVKGPSQKPNVPQPGQPYLEKNVFSPDDVAALAAAAPLPLAKEHIEKLGGILRQALDQGHQLDTFLSELKPQLGAADGGLDRRQLALVLVSAAEPLSLAELLPSADEAEAKDDREGLNLIARYTLARFEKEQKISWLEEAWRATQAALAVGDVDEAVEKEALTRAVEIAPRIQKELGQAWLDESFTERPERGMDILAAIGAASSTALQSQPLDAEKRFKLLELQTTAAKALLEAAPERASEWKSQLELLATNWLREALVTYQLDESSSLGPRMQRDPYGNFFYWSGGNVRQGNVPVPIATGKVLDIRPSDGWLGRIDATLRPRFHMLFAQLLLKAADEAQAFPYIEQLAALHPKPAKELVDEFLRVWAKNHDPNQNRNRSNPYIFFYGFEQRASGIPLTRSKQERNLTELAQWVERLRKLPVELDVELLATAFTTAHSTAEVYRLETIEGIFGSLEELDPATLAELVQRMRSNLTSVWQDPAVQEEKKTNRRQQDIQAEVLRGYELAHSTLERALEDHPKSWELWLAQAALEHDETNYRQELKKDSSFSSSREESFETFAEAARLYAEAAESLEREKETCKVHETWFYAALGACDLNAIGHDKQLAARQIPLIRSSLDGLGGERTKRHLDMFASSLFTRMQSVSPAVKFRYVREGLAIAGDNELAREARQVFDYYGDLVTEIQLRTAIDGNDRVGHAQPFGLRVDIRHTREIERESGGFSKYLQNQNTQNFGWNYGRPLEDYRDKFEEAAREALREHFEVLTVTFNDPQARSRAEPEYGWRVTPYAYLLLKARGPQVDRVPPLRLDLDFLDTSGYAVIPVESAALPIDARAAQGESRPYEELALTQTLDERQAKEAKLVLEVKATARGLVPELDELLDLSPEAFEVVEREDHGVSVVKFDEEGDRVLSERTWTIAMRAREGLAKLPDSFTFGAPRIETASNEHFRYVDADLASVGPTVSLERSYGKPRRTWMWSIPAALLAGAAAFLGWRRLQRPRALARARFQIPERLTPFTVLGLLRDIEANDGLAPEQRSQLARDIERLERHYFGEEGREEPDLLRIAEGWALRAN